MGGAWGGEWEYGWGGSVGGAGVGVSGSGSWKGVGVGGGAGVGWRVGGKLENLRSCLRIQNQSLSDLLWFLPQLLCEGRASKRNARVLLPSSLDILSTRKINRKRSLKQTWQVNACNCGTWDSDVGESRVQGWPRLHKALSQKYKQRSRRPLSYSARQTS